jgi:hypothetical protein
MKKVALLLTLCCVLGLVPALAQNIAPTLTPSFALVYGCNWLSESNGVHSVGSTSCDYPASADFYFYGDDNIGTDWSGDVGSYDVSFCGTYNSDGTYSPFGEPILPSSGSSDCSWIVGGYNYIYHNGVFFDGSGGVQTWWYKVIANARGDGFALGNTSSGPILAMFRGTDNSRVFAKSVLNGGTMTRDKGGNIYIAGGSQVTKYSPLAAKVVYSASVANTNIDSIWVDTFGQVYLAGTTYGGIPIVNAPQPQLGGGADGFIAVLSAKGDRIVYSSYVGGTGTETAAGISVDSIGNAYMAGTDLSYAWDGRPDPCDSGYANCSEMYYVARFGPFRNSSLPTKATFGSRNVGTTTTKNILFKNAGNVPLHISGIHVSGAQYAEANKCSVPVNPDKTCTIAISFTPLSTGEHDGMLVVTSDSLTSPQKLVLTGAGK